jgi:hypothetical protein
MLRRANRRGPKCHQEVSCKKIGKIQQFIYFPEIDEFQAHNRNDHNLPEFISNQEEERVIPKFDGGVDVSP